MRTSNFFSIAALVICGMVCVTNVKGEGSGATSNSVTVNLKFKPVQSISVNPTQEEVNFVYDSETDYLEGVTLATYEKHLKVFSTGGFEVKVKASNDFTSENTNLTIPVEHVSVTATASDGNTITYTSIGETQPLDVAEEKMIIQSSEGGTELEFDVEYENTGYSNGAYINMYNSEHEDEDGEIVFTTTVTYSIETI